MKWLSSFLAILVLFLSVQPVCAASSARPQVDACCADDCGREESKDDAHDKDACKACNPFQSCACCAGGVVVPQASFSVRQFVPVVSAPMWGQPAASASEASLPGFWQPPKRA